MDSGMGHPIGSPKEKEWRVYVTRKKRDMSEGKNGKEEVGSYTCQLVVVNKCGGLRGERAVC